MANSDVNVLVSRSVLAWTLGGCVLATVLTALVYAQYREVNVWQSFEEAQAFRHPSPTDPLVVGSIFRTSANTWSNLAYVYVGIYALAVSISDWRRRARGNYLAETPGMGLFFGVSCVYLGIGSGIFHASLTRWGQQLDVAAMYSTLVALLALSLARQWPRLGGRASWPFWIVLAVVVDVLFYIYKWQMSSIIVLPLLILLVLAASIRDRFTAPEHTRVRWVFVSSICLIVAVACRGLDSVGPLTAPDVWLTGHALWHVFAALSLHWMFVYYRDERQPSTSWNA